MDEINKAFNLYKENLKIIFPRFFEVMFLLLFFMFVFASSVGFNMFMQPYPEDFVLEEEALVKNERSLILLAVIFPILYLYVNSAANSAIINMSIAANRGEKADFSHGIHGVKKFSFKIFLFQIFRIVVLIVFMLVFLVLTVLMTGIERGIESIEGMLFRIIFMIIIVLLIYGIFYAFTLLTPQYIVLGFGFVEAMENSIRYVRRNILKIIIYGLLVLFGMILISIIPAIISYPIVFASKMAANIVNIFTTFLLIVLITPYFEVLKTVMVLEYEKDSNNRW